MTLPVSSSISLNDVNVEFGRSATTAVSLNDADVRTLFAKTGSATTNSLLDGRGKSYYRLGTVDTFQVTNYGAYITMICSISGGQPGATIELNLWSTDSGQATGRITIGTLNGSGALNYTANIYDPDPYWFPAPIINRYHVEQDGNILLTRGLSS